MIIVDDYSLLKVTCKLEENTEILLMYPCYDIKEFPVKGKEFYGLVCMVPKAAIPSGYILVYTRDDVSSKLMNMDMQIEVKSNIRNYIHKLYINYIVPSKWFIVDIFGGYKI